MLVAEGGSMRINIAQMLFLTFVFAVLLVLWSLIDVSDIGMCVRLDGVGEYWQEWASFSVQGSWRGSRGGVPDGGGGVGCCWLCHHLPLPGLKTPVKAPSFASNACSCFTGVRCHAASCVR